MRTKLDRDIERKTDMESIICGIWAEASRRGECHDWIIKQIDTRVYQTDKFKKAPQWVKYYLNGVSMAMLRAAQMWRMFGVWRFNGVAWANDWDTLPEHVKDEIRADRIKYESGWLPHHLDNLKDRLSADVKSF